MREGCRRGRSIARKGWRRRSAIMVFYTFVFSKPLPRASATQEPRPSINRATPTDPASTPSEYCYWQRHRSHSQLNQLRGYRLAL